MCDVLTNDKSIVLNKFNLFQNFPNPFNPSTNIAFSIEDGDIYELSIFGLNGNRVVTLFSEYKIPGNYFIQWDSIDKKYGLKVPSGGYIYVLKSSRKRKQKR